MKLFNYMRAVGAFTDGMQVISLPVAPTDRQEKKMVEEANRLLAAGWLRRTEWLDKREQQTGDEVDLEAEKAAFYPKVEGARVSMPLQYIQDFMVKKMAAMQNNVSIHNTKEIAEVMEIFNGYGVVLHKEFKGLVFDYINWTAKPGQKPKLLLHAKDAAADDEVVIRFEAAGELCQKFLHATLEMKLQPGDIINLRFDAVDPAIERNKRAGKKVADVGVYVNHNLYLTRGTTTHTGHPPKGTRFVQEPTMQTMEAMFRQALNVTQASAR